MPVLPWSRSSSGYNARFEHEVLPDYGKMPFATAIAGPAWTATSSSPDQPSSPTSSVASPPTSSAVVIPTHQAWTKEALLIIAIVLGGLVVFCLFFAILGRIIGLNQRWKDIDLHVRGVAVPQSSRLPTPAVEQSGPYGEHGGSASTLFTTRRNIPTLPQRNRREPIDGSSTTSNSRSSPLIGAQADPERGYDEVDLRAGNTTRRVSGQSTTSSRVWRWIKSSFTGNAQHEEEPSLGPPRRADIQSFLRPTPTRYTPWSLPFVNAAAAIAPFTAPAPDLMASPRGYTIFDADRAALNRQAQLPRRSRPEDRVASWREEVPDFVANSARSGQQKQSQRHRRQPSTMDHEGSSNSHLTSGASKSKSTDVARQTSYSYRANSLADQAGPSQRSRRLTSAHLLEAGGQGVRQRNVSQQQKSHAAPQVIISSAEPSEPSVYSKESAPTNGLSEEEQTRQILQRLERGFSTKSEAEAEDVIAFEPDSPTLTEGNGLLSPAVVRSGRTETAEKLLYNARERAARNGIRTSIDSKATSPRASDLVEAPVDESLDMDASAPSFLNLSGKFLAALSPHLSESGARLRRDVCPPERSSSPSPVSGMTTSEEESDEAKEAEYGPACNEASQTLMLPTLSQGKEAEIPSGLVGATTGDQALKSFAPSQRVCLPREISPGVSANSVPMEDAEITPRGTPQTASSRVNSKSRRQSISELQAPGPVVRSVQPAPTPPRTSGRVLLATPPAATVASTSSGFAASPFEGSPEGTPTLRPFAPLASLIPAGMSSPPAASSRASSRTGGKRKMIR